LRGSLEGGTHEVTRQFDDFLSSGARTIGFGWAGAQHELGGKLERAPEVPANHSALSVSQRDPEAALRLGVAMGRELRVWPEFRRGRHLHR
jgi:hypothetical protein